MKNKGVFIGLASMVVLSITTLQTIIMTRLLGPIEVGNYALIRQFSLIGAQILTMGMPSGLVYYLGNTQLDPFRVLKNSLTFHFFLTLVYSVFLGLMYLLFKPEVMRIGALSWVVPALYALLVGFRQYFYFYFLFKLKVQSTIIIDVVPFVISFIVLMLWIKFFGISLYVVIIADLIIVPLIGLVAASILLRGKAILSNVKNINFVQINSQFKYGFWLNLVDILMMIQVFLIYGAFSVGSIEIGYFARSLSITSIFYVGLTQTARYLYAKWTTGDTRESYLEFKKLLILTFVLSSIGVILLMNNSPIIMKTLFGLQFIPGYVYLRILAPCITLQVAFTIMSSYLNSIGLAKTNALIFLIVIIFMQLSIVLTRSNQKPTRVAYFYLLSLFLLVVAQLICIYRKNNFSNKVRLNDEGLS